jgi:hypothetical protein
LKENKNSNKPITPPKAQQGQQYPYKQPRQSHEQKLPEKQKINKKKTKNEEMKLLKSSGDELRLEFV